MSGYAATALVRGLAIGGEVVLAAEPVVIDPGYMRDARVERRALDGVGVSGSGSGVSGGVSSVSSVSSVSADSSSGSGVSGSGEELMRC
jgi:hypothetical protein